MKTSLMRITALAIAAAFVAITVASPASAGRRDDANFHYSGTSKCVGTKCK